MGTLFVQGDQELTDGDNSSYAAEDWTSKAKQSF